MPAISATGTQVATLGTLHTLATVTDEGTYVLRVDTAALAAGEVLELEIHVRTAAGGVTRRAYAVACVGVQADPVRDSLAVPLPAGRELVVKLRQTGGVGRSFPWDLISL